jgi:3-phenylpropionate/trans-cinnamate dioxygenase ferredoxin reductase subunit
MHIVIIGNGIAGITTARYLRKQDPQVRISVISSETEHFFSRTALMYIYMGHMQYEHTKPYEDSFWAKNRIDLINKHVTRLDPEGKAVVFSDGGQMRYDKLLLATGSASNRFGWPGQDLDGVQGLYSYQDLLTLEQWSAGLQHAVVVGGGLIGIELVEMLHARHIPVTFLVRESSFWNGIMPPEESQMINEEIRRHGIDLRLATELKEIVGDKGGRARAVTTSTGETLACQFVGLTAGVHPRIELAEGTAIETQKGFLVDEYLQTSLPDIYAAGDCAQLRQPAPGRRAIEAVWYTGKHMGPVLARTLLGEPTPYRQPTWFNSAKFMDIEWQTYGDVRNRPQEGEKHLVWVHPDGKKSVRIVYDEASRAVRGFNLMGIRYRADVCLKWIDSQTPVEAVLPKLALANFDPELYRQHEADMIQAFNQQGGFSLQLKPKRSLKKVFAFLKD